MECLQSRSSIPQHLACKPLSRFTHLCASLNTDMCLISFFPSTGWPTRPDWCQCLSHYFSELGHAISQRSPEQYFLDEPVLILPFCHENLLGITLRCLLPAGFCNVTVQCIPNFSSRSLPPKCYLFFTVWSLHSFQRPVCDSMFRSYWLIIATNRSLLLLNSLAVIHIPTGIGCASWLMDINVLSLTHAQVFACSSKPFKVHLTLIGHVSFHHKPLSSTHNHPNSKEMALWIANKDMCMGLIKWGYIASLVRADETNDNTQLSTTNTHCGI